MSGGLLDPNAVPIGSGPGSSVYGWSSYQPPPPTPTYNYVMPAPAYVAPPPPPDTPSIRVEQPATLGSVRGSHIPVGRGTRRVGGRPIDRVVSTTANTDGSWPRTVAYSFGSRLTATIAPELVELTANGLTIWSSEGGASSGVTVRFYSGSETQTADPALVAEHGATKTPAYRDHIYAVIEFDSLFPYGNAEPRVTARLKDAGFAGETIAVPTILEAVCERCGLTTDTTEIANIDAIGFGASDYVHGVHIAGEVHPLDLLKNAGRLWNFDYFESGKGVRLRKVDVPVVTPDLADVPNNHRLALSSDGSTITTKAASRHVAKVVEVSYQDTTISEQVSVQRARNEGADSADVERWDVPFVMTASRALTQASLALQQAEAEADEHKHSLIPSYATLEPGDTVAFSVEGKDYVAKVWAVTINGDFSVEVEYRNLTESRGEWETQTEVVTPVEPPDAEDNVLEAGTAALVLTGAAPTVTSVPGMITGVASVTLTGFDPTVAAAAANIEPGTAALTVTGNAPALTGDANLASVVFLTSFDGVDGATSDTEFTGKALTFVGNAQIDTAQSKFGGSSLLLDGTGDYVTAADSADFDFGAGQFTVELWVRHNTGFSTNEAYIGQWGSTTAEQAWFLFLNSGSLTFRVQTAGGLINTTVAWTPTVSTWYALAVDRDATGKFRIYRDGVMVASSAALGTAIQNGTGLLGIGRVPSLSTYDLQGWIDEIRVTKGVARYASDSGYTVPTAAFPRF